MRRPPFRSLARHAALAAAGASLATAAPPRRSPALAPHRDGPPPAHTGGFGEPSCRQCHFDAELNEPGGQLILDGAPRRYRPGHTYDLVVVLRRVGMLRAGFQLAARFAEGAAAGTQAGALSPLDNRAATVRDTTSGVLYLQHTRAGTTVSVDTTSWRFRWAAPAARRGAVVFHVAANAANDDDSPLGDFIYVTALTLPPD